MKRFSFIILFGISILLSWQCIDPPAEPIIPTWDMELSLPLINRSYMLEELVEKNPDILGIDEYGTLVYSYSDTMYNEPIGDIIRLQPESTDFLFAVGVFRLFPPDVEFNINVADQIGLPGGFQGPLLGISPVFVAGELPPIESINYMIVQSGSTSLRLSNETGVPLEIQDGVTIINSDDGTVVGVFMYNGVIEPGDAVESDIDLINTRVYHQLEFNFSFESPARDEVDIPGEPEIKFTLYFDELWINEAEAQVPDQILPSSFTDEIMIDDSIFIKEALFSRGGLEFSIENTTTIDLRASILFPELVSRNNPSQRYRLEERIRSGHTNDYVIDMREWMVYSDVPTNILTYGVEIEVIDADEEFHIFRSTDMLQGELKSQDYPDHELIVERIEGIIPPTLYEVSEYFELDIGDVAEFFEGDVTLKDVRLNIGLFFDGGFDATAHLHIVAENTRGVRDSVKIPDEQRHIGSNGWSSIVLDNSNSSIAEFFSAFIPHFPDRVYLSGNLIINPESEPGFIDERNVLMSAVELEVPFDIGITDGVVRDTLSVGESGDDLDRDMFDYMNYGRIYFETDNGIPVDMELNINLLCDEGIVLRQIPLAGQPAIGIKAAPVDSSGRVIDTSGRDVRMLELTRNDIQILRDTDRTELVLFIKTNNDAETVLFKSDDTITMRVSATFSVKADFN